MRGGYTRSVDLDVWDLCFLMLMWQLSMISAGGWHMATSRRQWRTRVEYFGLNLNRRLLPLLWQWLQQKPHRVGFISGQLLRRWPCLKPNTGFSEKQTTVFSVTKDAAETFPPLTKLFHRLKLSAWVSACVLCSCLVPKPHLKYFVPCWLLQKKE